MQSTRRRRRIAAILFVLAAAATAGVLAVATTAPARAPKHPLVASSQLRPTAPETPSPDTTPESDGAAEPEDVTATAGAAPAPSSPAPRRESVPGHAQGGTAAPPRPTGPSVSVPILLYHYVRTNPVASDREGFRLSVTPASFARQMALLHADGAHAVSLAEVMRALAGGPPLPPRPVVLTFDDGHDDFAYRAVPVLQDNGLTATSFVVPGFLGRSSYMTVDQLHAVVAAGMTIGAHTMHHVDLARVSPSVAADEITRSRSVLQQLTGQPVDDFAYPYGIFTSRVVAMVASAGFADAATTEPGARQYASQPFLLRRSEVGGYDTLGSFAQKAGLPAPPSGWIAPPASPPPWGPASPSPSGSPDVCPQAQAATPQPAAAGRESPAPSSSPSPDRSPCATPQARRRHGG
ncbi:MAG TPA: polysaccharide deacetylase family protein [Candidatus Dormibacteraeota bacterium]|nr:polysaccharide deacetylase family protein [Candidatus Dormibacteraeota bacterium]